MHQSEETPSLSPWWRHTIILVMIAGFSVLSYITYRTYTDAPPIPVRVEDASGRTLFTSAEILRGQEVFLRYGLMEHGTLWGHGAYLGPDYSADTLHQAVAVERDTLAHSRYARAYAALETGAAAEVADAVRRNLKENRYDPGTGVLRFTDLDAAALAASRAHWAGYFSGSTAAAGLPRSYIGDRRELDDLATYFTWAAWAAVANRPGRDYSYTNNWPYDPAAGNTPSSATYLWSALSLITLLGGLGTVLLMFGRFDYLGWHQAEASGHSHENALTVVGMDPKSARDGLVPRCRRDPLPGTDVPRRRPRALSGRAGLVLRCRPGARAPVQPGAHMASAAVDLLDRHRLGRRRALACAAGWRRGAAGQRAGVIVLLAALAVVVFGSLFGEYLGINGALGQAWFWLGHQGSEYLDLGRFWQVLLAIGLTFWLVLMYRALRPVMRRGNRSELAALFLYAAAAIPLFYLPALFYGPRTNFAVIDNWRFWIIHLWVEGFFELFATVLVAVMFHLLGLVTGKTATRVVYLDAILYLGGGILGTGHHWYFTGQGTLNMALAASFSALEVVPLTLLTLDAWDFIRLRERQCAECGQALAGRHRWTINFLMAVGVWNFVGAGVFGFLINLPIVSYFEVGTVLTPNHGHAALFGVFGMLALAVVVFGLRALASEAAWARAERLVRFGFWGLNIGLGLMIVLDLFPAGVLQLRDSIANGYWHARQPAFTMTGPFHALEWVRLAGDSVFLVAGVVPLVTATLMVVLDPATYRSGERARLP